MCKIILLSVCFALALATKDVCHDDDAQIQGPNGESFTCEDIASFRMCRDVGPSGEGLMADVCECSCAKKMVDTSGEEAVSERKVPTRLQVLANLESHHSCGNYGYVDLGRKSHDGCGWFWAYECRWCVKMNHLNPLCEKDGVTKGNQFWSSHGRVYKSDFDDCFKRHGNPFLHSLRTTTGQCYDIPCERSEVEVSSDLIEKEDSTLEIEEKLAVDAQSEKMVDTSEEEAVSSREVPTRLQVLANSEPHFSCGDWIDLGRKSNDGCGWFWAYPCRWCVEKKHFNMDCETQGAFRGNQFWSSKGRVYKWDFDNCFKRHGASNTHFLHSLRTTTGQCYDLSCERMGEGLTFTSNAQSAMITSEDFAMYGFALVGIISVLFFLRSAFRSHFSDYKTIDETTTLEEVSA